MSRKVRVGVIGAGSWAVYSHIPNLAARPEVELVAVNRLELDLAERVKEQFGFQFATDDYKQVLKHELDIVLVSSPANWHYEHAKAALESGAHVLCEKPFTLQSDQAWELVRLADSLGKVIVIPYGWNYKNMIVKAKELMDEKGVGTIEAVMVHMASPVRELLKGTDTRGTYEGDAAFRADPKTWADPKISGGGYAPGQLTHALGISLLLTGLRAEEVYARVHNAGSQVDYHDAYSIKYENGAIGTVFGASNTAGDAANKHQLDVKIFGSEGQMIVDLERERVWLYRGEDDQVKLDLAENEGYYACDGPIDTMVDLVLGKKVSNLSTAELGARTVEIIEAAFKSVETGKSEKVG